VVYVTTTYVIWIRREDLLGALRSMGLGADGIWHEKNTCADLEGARCQQEQ
jgi:hypothetical protein